MNPARQIDDIDGAGFTAAQARERFRLGQPFVLRGCVEPERLFSFERFLAAMAEREVTVREFGPPPRPPKWQWSGYGRWFSLPFSAYAQMLSNGRAASRDIYLGQMAMAGYPGIEAVVGFFDAIARDWDLRRLYDDMDGNLWIGPPGHVEPLHSDEGDGTLLQLAGRKHVSLFPPSQLYNLYPFPLLGKVAPWVAQVELDRPDLERFPKLADALAHRYETIIGPGDLLYLPTQWSHEVSTLDDGGVVVSANRLWRIRPWHRNFCTARAGVWYVKRALPRRLVSAAHAFLSRRRAAAQARPGAGAAR